MNRLHYRPCASFLISIAVTAAIPVRAQDRIGVSAATTAAKSMPAPYVIHGFRSAAFGMTDAQLRAAIAKDFPGIAIIEVANAAERTRGLQVTVPHLDPGPGTAVVTYIFGATSKRLAHVNVVWAIAGNPSEDQRAAIVTAAAQLTDYFRALPNPPRASANVTPLGPNALMMFAAVDGRGAGLEVAVDGIRYTSSNQDKTTPAPTGPAILRISYLANVSNPDAYHPKPGAF